MRNMFFDFSKVRRRVPDSEKKAKKSQISLFLADSKSDALQSKQAEIQGPFLPSEWESLVMLALIIKRRGNFNEAQQNLWEQANALIGTGRFAELYAKLRFVVRLSAERQWNEPTEVQKPTKRKYVRRKKKV